MARFKKKHKRFVMLDRSTLESPAWRELSHAEMIAYIYIKNNFNGVNNGTIPLKYSELRGVMAGGTLSKALKGLNTKGWIEKTQHGGLFRYFCLYKLTGKHEEIR